MLNLNHPRAASVIAASVQLDLILDYSKRMTLSGVSGRRLMLEVVRPAFAALRWLNNERFDGSDDIRDGLDQLEAAAEALATQPLVVAEPRRSRFGRCPACGDSPTRPGRDDTTRYCSRCLDVIVPGLSLLRSLDRGFGTDGI